MNDPIAASERAISRGLARYLTPPDEAPEMCPVCRQEDGFCLCPKCAVCRGANECAYADCGCNEGCTNCDGAPDGGHTRTGDCLYSNEATASAEDHVTERSIDERREGRAQ